MTKVSHYIFTFELSGGGFRTVDREGVSTGFLLFLTKGISTGKRYTSTGEPMLSIKKDLIVVLQLNNPNRILRTLPFTFSTLYN